VFAKNIPYLVLSTLGVFIQMFMFLLSCQTEFLSITFLIIYVGAMAILFIFSLMVINVPQCSPFIFTNYVGFISFSLFLLGLRFVYEVSLLTNVHDIFNLYTLGQVAVTGEASLSELSYQAYDTLLFIEFLFDNDQELFLLSAVLLCAALCGVLSLALPSAQLNTAKHI
jgi:NADH:ubiquinone oxidoreductase subunit 6 (subunit J)